MRSETESNRRRVRSERPSQYFFGGLALSFRAIRLNSRENMTATDIQEVPILGNNIIRLGFHLIPYIVETVISALPSSTYVLFTDSHLAPLYLQSFDEAFQAAIANLPQESRPRWITHVIAPGEQSKSRETKAALEDLMLSHRCTRDTVVLALGGGVVGDLVGFVSANFMRGVRYCQIPTTLLAMVDSAVGGKVSPAQHLLAPRSNVDLCPVTDCYRHPARQESHRSILPTVLRLH